ncbi:MAG: serine/threonine protein kinase [Gammaproteobacteria bacterium]|nr:MAG: serine/threonine protein kinase [Gammaproteobacteria bacterium]
MALNLPTRPEVNEAEREKRKSYLAATLVTCVSVATVFAFYHIVQLGGSRIEQMRASASYDLSEMESRIRAAGEDIVRHKDNEALKTVETTYTVDQAEQLLQQETWVELGTWVDIPAGEFIMGTDRNLANDQDKPQHKRVLESYQIRKYPVTNAEYARFVAETQYRPPLHWDGGRMRPGDLLAPVTMVSWYDAAAYCDWAGARLPREAEWEKAARGDDGRRWPWGSRMDSDNLNTYYSVGSATDVTRYPSGASPYGVFDMAGNVSEWTADEFKAYQDSNASSELFIPKVGRATTTLDKSLKVVDLVEVEATYVVLRGGSFKSDPFATVTYHRNYSFPHYASNFYGFRCSKDIEGAEG